MSKLEVFAGACLLVALAGQLWYFRTILRQLRQLRRSIPPPGPLSVQPTQIPLAEFSGNSAEALAEKYGNEDRPVVAGNTVKLALLRAETYDDARAYRIVVAINSYLVRSRGAAIDFVLIKNLVDRHTQLAEQGIRYTTGVPLLIGLFALFFASSIGLLLLPDFSGELIDRAAVASAAVLFFSSVKWVAWSLVTGALLTLVTLGGLYPAARQEMRRRKNDLFTLVQTELLPSLYQDTTHSLQLMQSSLMHFQRSFAENIGALQELLNRNYETLKAQERIAEALQQVDVVRLVKANTDMFQSLGESARSLDQFRQYLAQMNHFVENTTDLAEKADNFLQRTERIEDIATNIREALAKNERLHHFIESHFSELEARGQLITQAVVKVDDVLDKSLGELMEHTQRKIRAIRELSAQQENHLLKTYDENEHIFGKLARIDDLHRNFAEYKTTSLQQQGEMLAQLQLLNERLGSGSSGGIFKKLFRS